MMPIAKLELETAEHAFRDFCESRLPENHPFQHAWDRHESHHGEIEDGMPLYSLIQAAILYGIQCEKMASANRFHAARITVPQTYLDKCDCHDWAASIRDHACQHKPGCPNFVMEYELAIMAKHRHEDQMRKIREISESNNP